MKNSDVRIGGKYFAKISGVILYVIVTGARTLEYFKSKGKRRVWSIRRVVPCPGARPLGWINAASLHKERPLEPLRFIPVKAFERPCPLVKTQAPLEAFDWEDVS